MRPLAPLSTLVADCRRGIAELLLALVAFCGVSPAAVLTDEEMYCDPWSIPLAEHPVVSLPDLNVLSHHLWPAMGDPVVAARVLPLLKPGDYVPGYVFTQNDYHLTPNVHYSADLTQGSLTATFSEGGLYHVQVIRQSGQSAISAIYAQTWPGETRRSAAATIIDLTGVDLFVVSNAGLPANDYENVAYEILRARGFNVCRAESLQKAVTLINALSTPPKRHVALVGHGGPGYITIGKIEPGMEPLNRFTAAGFADEVKDTVAKLTLISCSSGAGLEGQMFKDRLQDFGIESVRMFDTDTAATKYGNGKGDLSSVLPEPSAVAALMLAMVFFGQRVVRAAA